MTDILISISAQKRHIGRPLPKTP